MSDYNRVRAMYGNATAWSGSDHADRPDLLALRQSALAEFDEVMAQHDAEIRAQGLIEAAEWFEAQGFERDLTAALALRSRAERIRKDGAA